MPGTTRHEGDTIIFTDKRGSKRYRITQAIPSPDGSAVTLYVEEIEATCAENRDICRRRG
jgi:hypothetical protein